MHKLGTLRKKLAFRKYITSRGLRTLCICNTNSPETQIRWKYQSVTDLPTSLLTVVGSRDAYESKKWGIIPLMLLCKQAKKQPSLWMICLGWREGLLCKAGRPMGEERRLKFGRHQICIRLKTHGQSNNFASDSRLTRLASDNKANTQLPSDTHSQHLTQESDDSHLTRSSLTAWPDQA